MGFDWDRWLFDIYTHPDFFDTESALSAYIARGMQEASQETLPFSWSETPEYASVTLGVPEDGALENIGEPDEIVTAMIALENCGFFELLIHEWDDELSVHTNIWKPVIPAVQKGLF
ncbi:hypothetical protein HGA13_20485 [Nocardia speluncae]|uniref:Uncharacterized protein n=1 Tax=Nocardia speluncae TaxID=419477 RepID=A0A846XH09_9NOCA|nr:hypothetical protein [Nocardia speluncae]NKY35428.1 hypothetical protein [Nocardia speluncae]